MGDRRSNGVQTKESYRVVPGHRDEPVRHGLQRDVADEPLWDGPGPLSIRDGSTAWRPFAEGTGPARSGGGYMEVEQIVEATRSCAATFRISPGEPAGGCQRFLRRASRTGDTW